MRLRLFTAGFIITLTLLAASSSRGLEKGGDKAVAAELKKLEGTWVAESLEVMGEKKLTAEELKATTLTFKGDEVSFEIGGEKENGKARIKLDLSQKPKAMDWTTDKKDVPVFIYDLDGDTLKLCWRKPGGKRPTEFTSKDTDGLMVLKKK